MRYSFPLWGKVPEGRMREWTTKSTDSFRVSEFSLPHPSLRATFSRWEKGI